MIRKKEGFTLIEVVVVMAIIAVLAVLVVGAIQIARRTARDTQRRNDIKTIQTALEAYYSKFKKYPDNTDSDTCGGWDSGLKGSDPFLQPLVDEGILTEVPRDPTATTDCGGYRYYKYPTGYEGCNNTFYVIEVQFEGGADSSRPGWQCPTRNWIDEASWVSGSFE